MTLETSTTAQPGLHESIRTSARRTARLDGRLGVFVTPLHDRALADTPPDGPLAGLTLGVKDNIFENSAPTTAGSRVSLADTQAQGSAVTRLKQAGAVVVGKTSLMEYGLGLPGPDSIRPPVRNPWHMDRWAGGSSSGSGSGIVAGLFHAALATDTTGSLRIPAAYTGVTGLKPTRGRVPGTGVYPLAHSMDTIGPMAADIATCARLLQVMAGYDPADPWSSTRPVDDYVGAVDGAVDGVRIGVDPLTESADAGVDPRQPAVFEAALSVLREAGTRVRPVSVPGYPLLNVIGNIIMLAEANEIHADALERRWADYGRGTRWVFSAGAALTAFDYLRAQRLRGQLTAAVNALFDDVDVIVTPTCHLGAPPVAGMSPLDPTTYLGSMHTTAWSVTGHPVAVVPIGFTADGLPLSMSIVGPHWGESQVIRVASAFQRATEYHAMRPDWIREECDDA